MTQQGGLPRVAIMSGTRSEYGLLRRLIKEVHASPALELQLVVAGMHLVEELGGTRSAVAAEFPIAAEVPLQPTADTRVGMAEGVADGIRAFARTFEELQPDLLVVLGDRTEAFAAAVAASYLEVPIAQIHGGDQSGNPVDDFQRDAISRIATLHFPATERSAARLRELGVTGELVVSGAPGLDEIVGRVPATRSDVASACDLPEEQPWVVFLYHPNPAHDETQNAAEIAAALNGAHSWCEEIDATLVAIYPNNDAGHGEVIAALDAYQEHGNVRLFRSLPRDRFLDVLQNSTLLMGNSSCGVIESLPLGIPVLNIGDRQNDRERDGNVVDVPADSDAILCGTRQLATDKEIATSRLSATLAERRSVYGDGRTAPRIAAALHRFLRVAPPTSEVEDTSVQCF